MKHFVSTIKLEKVLDRTANLIDMLNCMSISGESIMTVLNAEPLSDTSEILGTVQLTFNELKITFNVIASSMSVISNFASRYNMCAAHYSSIEFAIVEPATLKITFTPPNEAYEKIISNFFSMTSENSSINWWKQKKKYFARSISFWFYYYSSDSEFSSASGAS